MSHVPAPKAVGVEAYDQSRHPSIAQAMLRLQHGDTGLSLWRALAIALSSIIGVDGVESLYSRSLRRANLLIPWLTPHQPQTIDAALDLLGSDLSARDVSDARDANSALLGIFADILIELIGELLTNSILRQAWGDDVVDHAGTEYQ